MITNTCRGALSHCKCFFYFFVIFPLKASAQGAQTAGTPVGMSPNHLVCVNAPNRNRWVWVRENSMCASEWVFVFSLVSSDGHVLHHCKKNGQLWTICVFCIWQICKKDNPQPPFKKIPSSQIVYNLTGVNVENYLVATANDFIRNRWMEDNLALFNSGAAKCLLMFY